MGGLISAPKPKVVQPTPEPAQAAAVAQSAADTQAAADAAAQQARVKAVERARRGLAGTIATTEVGVLAPMPGFLRRKTLLGE